MQTSLTEQFKATAEGQEAESILRACVHCGFCTATCPTYQLLGDELDGPRGRIYLIKQVLEGKEISAKTQTHLDRCLTCRSCETTCPSGVRYGRLIDIGRHVVEQQVPRPLAERVLRRTLRTLIPFRQRFGTLVKLGQTFSPLLPQRLRQKIPAMPTATAWPMTTHARKMLVLDGCVQPITAPNTNAAAARVLDRLGIQLIRAAGAGCCGALSQHLSAPEEASGFMRRNIDAWWPHVETGVEALVMTASGCGTLVKDYGEILKYDVNYAAKAARISSLTKDISEVLAVEDLSRLQKNLDATRIAYHAPCTLQHGQKINGIVEKILSIAGYELTPAADSHLCCGSAGTYSILQPQLSQRLLDNKLQSLDAGKPDCIATANIGCQMHLASKSTVPVKHWIELLDAPR
ncbi:MAG: glycolate oxidase subunit GlcF [Gammaproteobacteria bacterium]|nr:glycolate oxidase subunit GlcF [Gammaproteobacteria bacterium]